MSKVAKNVSVALVATALCIAAALPSYAETHALQPYAYVESHGHNAVDTGYYAKKDTKFVADFAFVSTSDGAIFGANRDATPNVHGIYRNGSGKIAWTINGAWWWSTWNPGSTTIAPAANRRIVATVNGTGNTASMVYYADGTTYTSTIDSNKAFTTEDASVSTWLFQWVTVSNNNTCAKMYSFEADNDCSSGAPAIFFAPTVDADGNAGFTNIVDGTFHGELNPDATTAMTFTDGIGNANDYKYEADTLSAKFYAYSADTDMGNVKFGEDAASGTTSAWIARGGTATLTAVPTSGHAFTGWTGDTRTITSGSVNDATITVASDRAAQLLANFAAGPILTLAADASVAWSEAEWQTGGASASAPTSGDAIIVLSGDATVSVDCDVALDSIRILGSGTLTLARGAHSYSVASMITDSDSGYLVTLSNGKIVFKYDDVGAIQELYMNPDPGETLTLDDGKLNFAAGAKIFPGQGGDEGGNSVIIGGFNAAGALVLNGVVEQTWTGSSFLGSSYETIFTNTRLDQIVPLLSYGKVGTKTDISYNTTYLYNAYNIDRDGDTMRFEFQKWDGTHTKGFYMEFKQSGNDIIGRKLTSGYFKNQNKLGQRMFKYENGTASLLSGVTDASYYQPKRIVVGPRSGSRSKLTFDVNGTQTVPAVSGSGVEVTFDANARGELTTEFKSGNLAKNDNWQTLTTEYELKDLVLRSGYLQGSYCGNVPVIVFGWTNDNATAGCQLQYITTDNSYMRAVDVVLRQGDGKVEIKRIQSLYLKSSNVTSIYGKRYLLNSDVTYRLLTAAEQAPYWLSTKATVPTATVNVSGANSMTDSAYVITCDSADVNHIFDFNAANANALPDKTTDCYGKAALNLTVGGAYNAGIRCAKITMHPGTTLYSKSSWTFHNTAQTVVIDNATLNLNNSSKYINDLVLTNGSVVTRGSYTRTGYGKDPTWRVVGEGVSTCASDISIVAGSTGKNGTKRTYTIDVADTVAGVASDFILSGNITHDSGYPNGAFRKAGAGTMEMQGTICITNNPVRVSGGTLLFGKTGAILQNAQLTLEGGTIACAAGTTNTMAAVTVSNSATIPVGSSAALTMANVSVAEGQTLAIDCEDGAYAKAVKVNATLSAETRSRIRLNGRRPRQSEDGYLCTGGFMLIVR